MSSIILKIENNVAFITLNRPEVFNSFNREMALKLQDIARYFGRMCYRC
jgi:2-(1,2-epoxy-1,2-dihydrophenyl)acetyl-CoA isomerase